MIRVGVAGGIGSGKTTFCKAWEELGAYVVYADDFAKELMVNDPELIKEIKTTFGDKAYFENGKLNRAFLADEAFTKGRVEELNNIVHPILWKRIHKLSLQKEEEGIKVFVKEAALLLDHGRPKHIDVVILLEANERERIDRVVERDKTNKDLVLARISKQRKKEDIDQLADHIIINDGSLEKLQETAKNLFFRVTK